MDLGPESNSFCSPERLQIGRDASYIRKFMEETKDYWSQTICGVCDRTLAQPRCRSHLCDDLDKRKTGTWESY